MKTKILVTGAAGFIGSNLSKKLLENNFDVIGIDNFEPNYSFEFKKENLSHLLSKNGFEFLTLDIRNLYQLKKELNHCSFDVVIHLAAKAGVLSSIEDIEGYLYSNVIGTKNILEFIREKKCEKIIFASSSSVYGASESSPFEESMPLFKPLTPYASSKIMGEHLTYNYYNVFDINVVNLRLFNVYGPCGRPDMAVYKFTDKIFKNEKIEINGDGKSKRDWTYIDDITDGIINSMYFLLENKNVYETINLGNSNPIELNNIIDFISKYSGKRIIKEYVNEKKGDMKFTCADISKAKRLISFDPKINIDDGIKLFINWFKKNRLK